MNKQYIQNFMQNFTLETTPGSAKKIADYREHIKPGGVVYITFLPDSDFSDTIEVAKRLRDEGFQPVPHFAARSIPSKEAFEDNLKRCVEEAGVDRVLVIAGAVDKPLGEFDSSIQLLQTGLFDKYGIKQIGLAGHPEGSPDITDAKINEALHLKNNFQNSTDAGLYLVTQFCFEAAPIIAWDKALQAADNKLPIHIGVPGLASLKSLIGHSKACGIGASMKFLTKQARNVAKLMVVNAPDKLITDLAIYQATDANCGIKNVHMYPLGGLSKTAKWSYSVQAGDFTMHKDEKGFEVIES